MKKPRFKGITFFSHRIFCLLALVLCFCLFSIPPAKAGDLPPPEDYGWKPLFKEPFESVDMNAAPWRVSSNYPIAKWTIRDDLQDSSNATSVRSAGAVPPGDGYPANLDDWLIYGPVKADGMMRLEAYFSFYLDMEQGDALSFCIGKGPNKGTDFPPELCKRFDRNTDKWALGFRDLSPYLKPDSPLFLAWIFQSKSGSNTKPGAFIDEFELVGTDQDAPPRFDFQDDFASWEALFEEHFDGQDLQSAGWQIFTLSDHTEQWAATQDRYDDSNPDSSGSAGVFQNAGGYPAGLETLMIYGPLDLSAMAEVKIKFTTLHNMEKIEDDNPLNDDWFGFYAGVADSAEAFKTKVPNLKTRHWLSGDSSGKWRPVHADLNPFTGNDNVYLAWYFKSVAGSDSKIGAFVDEIMVSGRSKSAQTPDIGFDNNGVLSANGSFDINSLFNWNHKPRLDKPALGDVTIQEKNGNIFAKISGNQFLYQLFPAPLDMNDLLVSFRYAVESTEETRNNDYFCVALTSPTDQEDVWVDFGCWDVIDFPDFSKETDRLTWDFFERSLDDEEIETVLAKGSDTVGFTITLQDEGDTDNTRLLIDDVNVYATGFYRRTDDGEILSIATQRDANEPNDDFGDATTIQCGETLSGVFGDVGGGFDRDYFRLTELNVGTIEIDIDARILTPPSKADTFIRLFDANGTKIGYNDHDGESLDAYLSFDNTVENQDYYIEVGSRHGGGPLFFYDLSIVCGDSKKRSIDGDDCIREKRAPRIARSNEMVGDLDGDNNVDVGDAVLALQTLTEIETAASSTADVDGDGKIGVHEAVYALQISAGLREAEGEGTWTAMLFLNGEDQGCVESGVESDCWTNYYETSIDKIEEYIGDKQEFLTVVALVDGPNFNNVESDVSRYVVQPNGVYTENQNKWSLDEINMGDPDTLSDFAQWAMTNYPADHYYLAIDNHGSGINGISWDYNDADGEIDDYLSIAELGSALKEITGNGLEKLDIFDFEACQMGLMENAYELKDYVNYVAFFQPISWTSYNYPEYFRDLEPGDDALTVGKKVIQGYPVVGDDYPYTYSLIDASKLESLREKVDAFAGELMNADLTAITAARDASQAFNGDVNKGDPTQDAIGYIDIAYFAEKIAESGIATSQAADVQAAVDMAVADTKATVSGHDPLWDYTNYHGMSILYPQQAYTFLSDYWRDYQMSLDGAWDEFLTEKVFAGYDFGRSGKKRNAARQEGGRLNNDPEIGEDRPPAF